MTFRPKAYSEAVERALKDVLPSDDPVDRPDFDPIAYLNARFPDEGSLANLDSFHQEVNRRLKTTEMELFRAVEGQTANAAAASKDLREIGGTVTRLTERVSEIRKKATKSEDTVQQLCQNIRQLDTAKSNLTASVNTLRYVQMWMLQLQTLNATFQRENYVQCRDALKDVQKYSEMFEKYKDLPKIKELNDKQKTLCAQIDHKIRNNVLGDTTGSINKQLLAEACAIIDVLGQKSIERVREHYIEKELEVYATKFKRGFEDARLDKAERRYIFIRTLLENQRSMFETVFPRHWCVPQELCVSWCLKTKADFDYLLKEAAGNIDMVVLTFVLQKTIDIERELTQMMAWRDSFPERDKLPDYKYNGLILSAFKAHMGLFVQNEDQLMEEALRGASQDEMLREDAVLHEGSTMAMAQVVFLFIRESLNRTIKISQQHILIDMAKVWKRHLLRLAATAQQVLPTFPATPAQFRKCCVIINTADSCQTTSVALGEQIAKRGECSPDEVSFEDVSQEYSALYTAAVMSVVSGLDKLLLPAFAEFASGAFMNVSSGEESHDESAYVGFIRRQCHEVVSTCAAILQPQILRFLLDKIASTLIPKYALYLYCLRSPSGMALAKVRVDCTALERMFKALPNVGNPDRFPESMLTHYTKLVHREFDRMKRELNVLSCETNDSFVEVYYEVTAPEDRSIQSFMLMVEQKGLKRDDVRPWIAALQKKNVAESTKRDVHRHALLQTLRQGLSGGNAVTSAAAGLFQSATTAFRSDASAAGPISPNANPPSSLEGVASRFRSIKPISHATTLLSNLKDRIAVSKEGGAPQGGR